MVLCHIFYSRQSLLCNGPQPRCQSVLPPARCAPIQSKSGTRLAKVKASVKVPVLGNGDIQTAEDAVEMMQRTGCDGVMIARAALGDPWLFERVNAAIEGLPTPKEPNLQARMNALRRQVEEAFWIRAQFDWLIGFNLSVAYTVKTGMLMRVGRVKAPTLKLVYDNCKAIDEFSSKSSYLPVIQTKDPEMVATLVDEEGKDLAFPELEKAKELVSGLGPEAIVKKTEKKETKKPPQQLYKLSDIQVEAGQKYGYSPDETLQALQSLYETHKVMSYPRTDGKHLSSEKAKEFSSLLRTVSAVPGMEPYLSSITPEAIQKAAANKRYVNDEEVKKSSHGALIPTGKIPDFSKMSEMEKNVCIMD